MCLVKDPVKGRDLLKHHFFKHAKSLEISVKKGFADLPPHWNHVKAPRYLIAEMHLPYFHFSW